MIISPKLNYISNDPRAADNIQEFLLSPVFQRAAEAALLEYAIGLDTSNPTTAPKLGGAKGFLDVLMDIGNKTPRNTLGGEPQLTPV